MKLRESSSELLAGLFLATLFIEVSFLPGDLSAQTPFYQGKTITDHTRQGPRRHRRYAG